MAGLAVVPGAGGAGRVLAVEANGSRERNNEVTPVNGEADVEQLTPPPKPEDPPRLTVRTKYLIYASVTMFMLGVHFPRPMLPGMCREMYSFPPDDVGFCNGAILATLQVGSFLSAFLLGHWSAPAHAPAHAPAPAPASPAPHAPRSSDVLGRKPVLVVSVAATAVALGSLGAFDSYSFALVVRPAPPRRVPTLAPPGLTDPALRRAPQNRFLGGFLDGTLPVTKGYVADVSAGTERSSVLSFYGGLFALSRTLSITLGGLLSLPKWVDPADTADWDWVSPHNYPDPAAIQRIHAASGSGYALIFALGSLPFVALLAALLLALPESRRAADGSRRPVTPAALGSALGSIFGTLWRGLGVVVRDPVLLRLNAIYFLQAFSYGGSMLGLVLYPLAPLHSRGLAFTPFAVGFAWGYNGLVGFVYRLFFFERLLVRHGLRRLYQAGLLCFFCGCLLLVLEAMPFSLGVPPERRPWALSYAVLLAASTFFGLGWIMGFPLLGAMLSHAAPRECQGLVQGVAESLAALAKAAAPGLLGALFSASLRARAPQLIFVAEFAIYAACFLISLTIPRHVGAPTGATPAPSPAPPDPAARRTAGAAEAAAVLTFPARRSGSISDPEDLRSAQAAAAALRGRLALSPPAPASPPPEPAGPAGGAGVPLPAVPYPATSEQISGPPDPARTVVLPPTHVWTTPQRGPAGRRGGT
eukprot:tig00021352_g20679.t1